jgi:hypothetical protein
VREQVEHNNNNDDNIFLLGLGTSVGDVWVFRLRLLLMELALGDASCFLAVVAQGWEAVLSIETNHGFVDGARYITGIATLIGDT